MIIDAHCHCGHGDVLTAPWSSSAPLDAYLERAREAGIGRSVVFAINNTDYQRANEQVAQLVRRHSSALIGFARVNCRADAGRIGAMIAQARRQWGFRGVKVHVADAPPTRELMEAAAQFGLPVLIDIMDQPGIVEMLAREFPAVGVVVAHLGSFSGNWQVHQAVIDLMVRYPNVHADSSSVRFFDYLAEAIWRAGPDKLIFGSDGPLLHPAVELAKIKLLKLDPQDEAKVLGGNLEHLLPLEEVTLPWPEG